MSFISHTSLWICNQNQQDLASWSCPALFASLTHLHLCRMDFSKGPKGARHIFDFDNTREPDAGPAGSGAHCRPLEKAKHISNTGCVTGRQAHLPHGRSHAAAARLCPCLSRFKPAGCAVSGWLLSRPALKPQHVAAPL